MQIAFQSSVIWRIYRWEFLVISFQKFILRANHSTVKFYKIRDPFCVCLCVYVYLWARPDMCGKMMFYCYTIRCQTLVVKRFSVSCDNSLNKYTLKFIPVDYFSSLSSCKHFGTYTLSCGGEELIELIKTYNYFPCQYQMIDHVSSLYNILAKTFNFQL
jgi:hypothetical protein